MKKVIVIGGGAAGMMAAVAAADTGHKVLLLEKNEKLGKKLFITGKGRCNVTNAADMETLFANVMSNAKFLYSAFYQYDNRAVMDFLEEAGCRLKVERGDRVFPVSDHSSDVIAAFQRQLQKRKVEICFHCNVKEILYESCQEEENICEEGSKPKAGRTHDKAARKVAGVKLSDGSVLSADSVIVATGGNSYASTGSTGDGYTFAEGAGHKLVEPCPSLVPFTVQEDFCRQLMGLSLKNVSVTLAEGKKTLYSDFGEMLFTHFGVSGPLILSASSYYVQHMRRRKKEERIQLFINLKPALSEEQLDKRLLRDFEENKNRQFKNSLGGLFPAKLIPVMIELSGIHPDKKVNEISRQERRSFVALIQKIPLTITGVRGYNEAIITKGGVSVKEVNPSTMESKKVKGLFFAGEVLDVDALTGGFNLQIAWSTGYLAGRNA